MQHSPCTWKGPTASELHIYNRHGTWLTCQNFPQLTTVPCNQLNFLFAVETGKAGLDPYLGVAIMKQPNGSL